MNPTRHLSFGSLRHALSSLFQHLPDPRQPGKVDYALHDALMSGFACMFFHSILKFFQVDNAGMLRLTSSARYFKEAVGPSRPN